MNLTMVTMTGADDSVEASQLGEITKHFPFVEWGILASIKQTGGYRFPSLNWIRVLQKMKRMYYPTMKLCLHLCGEYVRELLKGNNIIPAEMLEGFERVQLNFHANCPIDPERFANALDAIGKTYIFQIDGSRGKSYLSEYFGYSGNPSAHPLFDTSGGAGEVAKEWPAPFQMIDDESYDEHGYAGGLGPHNIDSELQRIAKAAGNIKFWIDMETHIRSYADSMFDLAKVRSVLESVKGHVKQ